jgi:hypothetical protein
MPGKACRGAEISEITNSERKMNKAAGFRAGGLYLIWLLAVDTLRNLFYTPTMEMKITFELLRQTGYPL